MTKAEEILDTKNWSNEYPNFMAQSEILDAMEDYAKYHAMKAFDAGFNMGNSNFPEDFLNKEEYIAQTFNQE